MWYTSRLDGRRLHVKHARSRDPMFASGSRSPAMPRWTVKMLATATKPRPYSRRPRHTAAGIPLPRIDQRRIGAMRFRTLLDAYAAELGGALTEPEKALVLQIASMQIRIDQLQAEIVEGRDVDADQDHSTVIRTPTATDQPPRQRR
jgi:hypothetical protein